MSVEIPENRTDLPGPRIPRRAIAWFLCSVVCAVVGVWLQVHDRPELNREVSLRAKRTVLDAKLVDVEKRSVALATAIPYEENRVVQTEKNIRQLSELQSTWSLLTGNRAQQKANAERIEQMQASHAASVARIAELQQDLSSAQSEREKHEIERERIEAELRVIQADKASALYHVRRAGLRLRAWIVLGAAIGFGGAAFRIAFVRRWKRRADGTIALR